MCSRVYAERYSGTVDLWYCGPRGVSHVRYTCQLQCKNLNFRPGDVSTRYHRDDESMATMMKKASQEQLACDRGLIPPFRPFLFNDDFVSS